MKGICTFSFIPMRAQPSEAAEMVSQVIFGESYDIIKTEGRWTFIKTVLDNYEGWIDFKLAEPVTDEEYDDWMSRERVIVYDTDPTGYDAFCPISPCQRISIGSEVRMKRHEVTWDSRYDKELSMFKIGKKEFLSPVQHVFLDSKPYMYQIMESLLGTPYIWGGRSAFGIDCSGFSQLIYKFLGLDIPRDASQQINLGTEVALADAKEYDLAFFVNPDGKICHVAVVLDPHTVIHSSGSVRKDSLDEEGIFNKERNLYTHKLLKIKHIKDFK